MTSAPETPKPGTVKRTLLSGNPAHTERPAKILASLERSQSVAISGTRRRPSAKTISYPRHNHRRLWGNVARGAMAVVAVGLLIAAGLAVRAQWKSPLFAAQQAADHATPTPVVQTAVADAAPSWSTTDSIPSNQAPEQTADQATDQLPEQAPDVANIITVPAPTQRAAQDTPAATPVTVAAPTTLAVARPASTETRTAARTPAHTSAPTRTATTAQRPSKTAAATAGAAASSTSPAAAPDSDVDLLAALLARMTQRDPAPPIQPTAPKPTQDLRTAEPCSTTGSNSAACAHP